jgi:Mrp family chromosome partitioning ATPase
MQSDQSTLTLQDYLVPVWKRRWMILALVVVITAIVSVYYARRPPTYRATTQVFVGPEGGASPGVAAAPPTPQQLANQATLLTSTETAAVVAKAIGYKGSAGSLAGSVTALPSTTTSFITISSHASSAALAATIVNAFARQFISSNAAQQVTANNKQIAALQHQLKSLPASQTGQRQTYLSQIQELQLLSSAAVGSATQINPAHGASASRKSPIMYGLLAALGSLIGGILLAFLLERLDPTLRGIKHTEMIYEHPVLATVWHDDGIGHFVDDKPSLSPRSREAFRDLRIGLYLAGGEDIKTVVVSSAVPAEGKSTVARNLALALSEGGRRVMLIDADLRWPALARGLGVKPRSGLIDLLGGTRTLDEVTVEVPIDVAKSRARSWLTKDAAAAADTDSVNGVPDTVGADDNGASNNGDDASVDRAANLPGFHARSSLSFIPSGTKAPNPQGILESDGFRELVHELRGSYDAVVIDSTPLTLVSDAIPVVRCVDAVLLVARSTTDSRSARHASEIMKRVPGANIVGLVVNDVPESVAAAYGKGYGYGHYGYGYARRYGYGYGDESEAREEPAPGAEAPAATPESD